MNSVTGSAGPVALEDVTALVRAALGSRRDSSVELGESTRIEDLDLASLQLANIVFRLEEEKGVRFDGGEVSELSTLGELVALANRQRLPG